MRAEAATPDPVDSARAAGLRYVLDLAPGITRRRAGKGFYYVSADGRRVSDRETLSRIRSLAIPPAWTGVWICPDPRGHLQATGFDSKGRKQYRYHPRWREVRDGAKYDRMLAFAAALPAIRERTDRDLSLPGMPRERVLAAVVRLLDDTLIRVGNEEYRRENGSYGLTTLRKRHVEVAGSRVSFSFKGKAGRKHSVAITNRRLARVVRNSQEIPGQQLFHYLDDDGIPHSVESGDVNDYLGEVSGGEFTAKDFRTWAGSVLATGALSEEDPAPAEQERKRQVTAAVDQVALLLGNTPAVCRKCYVHPAVIEAFLDGTLSDLRRRASRRNGHDGDSLSRNERLLIALLRP